MSKKITFLACSTCIFALLLSYFLARDKSLTDEEYFEEAIELMEENSVNKNSLDWDLIKKEVFEYSKTHDKKSTALKLLELTETNHSSFRNKDGKLLAFHNDLGCEFEHSEDLKIPENIGYIRIDQYRGRGLEKRIEFAEQIQDSIRKQDKKDLKGWIIDLRFNTGGSIDPMVAGLGPILGNNKVGYFVNPNKSSDDKNKVVAYGYHKGSTIVRYARLTIEQPYILKHPEKPVVVLTSSITSSSGEAIAIAFKHHPNTIHVGEKTCGMATANKRFKMSDDSLLILTTSYMTDRKMNRYDNGVLPDVVIDAEDALGYSIGHLQE